MSDAPRRFRIGDRVVLFGNVNGFRLREVGTVAYHLTGDGMLVVKLDSGGRQTAHVSRLIPESAVDRLAKVMPPDDLHPRRQG